MAFTLLQLLLLLHLQLFLLLVYGKLHREYGELIWRPWILSIRPLFKCTLSFGGDSSYCLPLLTIDFYKTMKL